MSQTDKPCIACGQAHQPGPCPNDPLAPRRAVPAADSNAKLMVSLQGLAALVVSMREDLADAVRTAERLNQELWDLYNGIDQKRRRGKS